MKTLNFFYLGFALTVKSQDFKNPSSPKTQIKTSSSTLTKAKAYIKLFTTYQPKNLNKAKLYLDTAKLLNNKIKNATLLMAVNNKYASYFFDIGQPDSAKLYAQKSLHLAKKLHNKVSMVTSIGLVANAYSLKNDFKNMLKNQGLHFISMASPAIRSYAHGP